MPSYNVHLAVWPTLIVCWRNNLILNTASLKSAKCGRDPIGLQITGYFSRHTSLRYSAGIATDKDIYSKKSPVISYTVRV